MVVLQVRVEAPVLGHQNSLPEGVVGVAVALAELGLALGVRGKVAGQEANRGVVVPEPQAHRALVARLGHAQIHALDHPGVGPFVRHKVPILHLVRAGKDGQRDHPVKAQLGLCAANRLLEHGVALGPAQVLVQGRLELFHDQALLQAHHINIVPRRDPQPQIPNALQVALPQIKCGGEDSGFLVGGLEPGQVDPVPVRLVVQQIVLKEEDLADARKLPGQDQTAQRRLAATEAIHQRVEEATQGHEQGMHDARPDVGAPRAALDRTVQQAKEMGDEEDDEDLGHLVVDVHQILLVGLVRQRGKVPLDGAVDAEVHEANEDRGAHHTRIEKYEFEVVVRRPAPQRGVRVRVLEPQARGDEEGNRNGHHEVPLEHLLRALEGEVQDNQAVDMEGDAVRPQYVHQPQELDPKALEVAGKLVLARPVAHEPGNGQTQIHQAQDQHQLVHVGELPAALQGPALLGHHGTAHDGDEGREPRDGLHGGGIVETGGVNVVMHYGMWWTRGATASARGVGM